MNLDDYKCIPLDSVTNPSDGLFSIYKDHWWVVTPNNEILKWRNASMQCNIHKEIAERLAPEGCKVVQVPFVFIRTEPWEFA